MNNSKYGYFFCLCTSKYVYTVHTLLLLLFILIYSNKVLGQYSVIGNGTALSPHVINSNGGTVLISQMWVDWNVGDLAATYKTVQHPVLFLTTGFLQSDPDVLLLFKDFSSLGEQIKIGPNPFYSGIHIYCKQVGITILSIRIMDSKGNLLCTNWLYYIKQRFT